MACTFCYRSCCRQLLLLLLSVLLSACGKSGPAQPSLFPLNEGWSWNYKVTTSDINGTKVTDLHVHNRTAVALTDQINAIERRNSLGLSYYFVVQANAITRLATKNQFENLPRLDMDETPRHVLPLPPKLGSKWLMTTRAYLLHRQRDQLDDIRFARPFTMSFEIDALDQTITVPAGTFRNCVVVAGHYMMPVMADVITGMELVPINQKEWYCPEAGMVKFIRAESIVSRLVLGGTMVMELVNLDH